MVPACGSRKQSSSFREYTHTDQSKVVVKINFKLTGIMDICLISENAVEVLYLKELQGQRGRAEVL